jgi:hypothetical protein
MVKFAKRGADRRPHIAGPPPAGFVPRPANRLTREATQLEVTARKLTCLSGVEILDLEVHGAYPFASQAERGAG